MKKEKGNMMEVDSSEIYKNDSQMLQTFQLTKYGYTKVLSKNHFYKYLPNKI